MTTTSTESHVEQRNSDPVALSARLLSMRCTYLERVEPQDAETIRLRFLARDAADRIFFVVVTDRQHHFVDLMNLLDDRRIRKLAEAGAAFEVHVWDNHRCEVIELNAEDFADAPA